MMTFLAVICSAATLSATMNPLTTSFPATFKGFAINAVHHKIYLANTAPPQIIVAELYADSGALTGVTSQSVSCTTLTVTAISLALDALKKKLYVGADNELYVYDLSDSGTLITPPNKYALTTGSVKMNNIYIDFIHNVLQWSGQAPILTNICFVKLGTDGLPLDTGTAYATSNFYHYAAVADLTLGMYYSATTGDMSGNYGTHGYRVNLDGNGYPSLFTQHYNIGATTNALLDPADKRLYIGRAAGFNNITSMYMWRLNDAGINESIDTIFFPYNVFSAQSLIIDGARRKGLIAGEFNGPFQSFVGYFGLDADGKPSSAIDTGFCAGSYIYAIAHEPFYNKIYAGSADNKLYVFDWPDSAMTPVKINNGETLTETPNVTLKFQCANPNFIYVSGDLLFIGNPVNVKDQWVACGGGFWKNTGDTMRAITLEIPAALSSGVGEKTIEVWYSGSTIGNGMCSNFTGMMRKASAKITLIESSASVNSVSLSRIDYNGVRVDYKVVDGRSRNVSVTVQYKTSTADWTDCSMGSNGEGRTGLTANYQGVAHYFIWNAEKDIPENSKDVQLRIKAENGDSQGVYVETGKYSVPDWTGSDLRVINVSIRKTDGSWLYRARLEWSGVSDTTASYEIQKKEDNGDWTFVATTSGTITEIENLSDTPVYSFKVRLRTKEGLFSAYSKSVNIKLTTKIIGTGTIGASGGTISIEDFDGNSENNPAVQIPEGTFREDVTISMERFAGSEYEINGKKQKNLSVTEQDFRKAVTIRLSYSRDEITAKGWIEDNLAIFYFDGIDWHSIGGTVDKSNTIVSAKVKHFSKYKVSANSIKEMISVVPDYFSPNADGIADVLNVYFSSQTTVEKAEITIYDINGKTVRVIKPDGLNTVFWDGRDSNNSLCESGLYILTIELGAQRVTKTFRLVR